MLKNTYNKHFLKILCSAAYNWKVWKCFIIVQAFSSNFEISGKPEKRKTVVCTGTEPRAALPRSRANTISYVLNRCLAAATSDTR